MTSTIKQLIKLGERELEIVSLLPLKVIRELSSIQAEHQLTDPAENDKFWFDRYMRTISVATGVAVEEIQEIPAKFEDLLLSYRLVLEISGLIAPKVGEVKAGAPPSPTIPGPGSTAD